MSVTLNELHDAMEACGWLDCVPEGCEWRRGDEDWHLCVRKGSPILKSVAIAAICMRVVERAAKIRLYLNGFSDDGRVRWFQMQGGELRIDSRDNKFPSHASAVLALLRKKPTLAQRFGQRALEKYAILVPGGSGIDEHQWARIVDRLEGIIDELAAQEDGR